MSQPSHLRSTAARAALASIVASVVLAGCGSRNDPPAAAQSSASAQQPPVATQQQLPTSAQQLAAADTAGPETAAPPAPGAAITQASWTPDALEELLAPVALYPDALLGQILAVSVNPQEVLDGGNWLLQNQNLTGAELDAAAEDVGFGPAMRALLQFPTVVDMLCQQIDWTRQVGSAFTSDQAAVLDAVQRLRQQAADVGNLESTPQQTVETKQEEGKTIVEVKPADPMVVYVPQYDPTVIYTTPPPPAPPLAPTTTVVAPQEDTVSKSSAVAGGLLAFGAGIVLANAFDDDDDYFYPHWGAGSIYVGPRPFYPPAYPYRPVYSPAFRPAYGYAPPPSYRYNYKSGNNVVINNNNYYNRFDNNQNLRTGNPSSPLGRSTYAGARNDATAERLNQAAGGRAANTPNLNTNAEARANHRAADAQAGARQANAGERAGNVGANRTGNAAGRQEAAANRAQHTDRGYGNSTRGSERAANRSVANPLPTPAAQPTPMNTAARAQNHAFAGAAERGTGNFDRAASARGHASAGSRPAARAGGARRR